jgi:hypothetical protein
MNTATASFPLRCAGFFFHPWSVSQALFIAVIAGAASPLLYWLVYWALPPEAAHFAFPAAGCVVLGLIYWRMECGQFRRDRAVMLGTLGAALFWVAGVVGSGWCCSLHICMDGHMTHPPYLWWHYAMDAGWVLALVIASLWTRILRVSLCISFAGLTSFLISYRFLFGSFGGNYVWLPL